MLPLSPGRDSVPWSPCPNQAPNLVSPSSRRVPFKPEHYQISSARLPISPGRFSPRGSQDQSRPRSDFTPLRAHCAEATQLPVPKVKQHRLNSYLHSGSPTFPAFSGDFTLRSNLVIAYQACTRLTLTASSRTPGLHRAVSQIFGAETLPLTRSASYP